MPGGQAVIVFFRRADANQTDLQFLTSELTKIKVDEELKIPEQAHEAKPGGISC